MPTTQNPLCPDCGVQLQDQTDLWSCPNCGFETDDPDNPAAGRSMDSLDADYDDTTGPDPDDDPVIMRKPTGLDYAEYVRDAKGLSVDELFAKAAEKVKPPKPPEPDQSALDDALGTAANAALAAAGSCPFCGADPSQITGGVCGSCGTTQPQGVDAWVVGGSDGKSYGACSELCAKVGAAQKDGRVMGRRPWAVPDGQPAECFVCGETLTAISPSAAAPAAPAAPAECPSCGEPRPDLTSGSVCPHCGHVEPEDDPDDDPPDVGTEVLR